LKLIVGLALLFGTLSINAQDPATTPEPQGRPPTAAQVRARIELSEAVRSYREGNLADARRHTEIAREYDPHNKIAPLFLARIIHRQYQRGNYNPENTAKAFEAIAAYRQILADDPQNEEAFKAIASLYGSVREDQLQRQWIQQRAVDATFSPEKRAEAYVILASKDWHCSNEITDLPANKRTRTVKNTEIIEYQKPKDEAAFQRAKQCLTRGLEEIELAIELTPEYLAAWSYKTSLLLEGSKLAEMEGLRQSKIDFERRAKSAQLLTGELSKKQKQEPPEEIDATEPESPPATRPREEPQP